MTVYYEPRYGVTLSACLIKHTCIPKVVLRFDFWLFLIAHTCIVGLVGSGIAPADGAFEIPMESAWVLFFFTTFFITYYNNHCYKRFLYIYDEVMLLCDAAILFVHELTVSYNMPEMEQHRTLCAKYILCAVYVFFLGLTGGELTRHELEEMVHKGFLSHTEMELIHQYPAESDGKVMVLTAWAMMVIDDANEQDCVHSLRSRQPEHMHDRVLKSLRQLQDAMFHIGAITALPFPFLYFHIMNLLLFGSMGISGIAAGLYGSVWTIAPFAGCLIVFQGIREVAVQLADPFGRDDVDLPVQHFLNYTFDQSISLLESFTGMDGHIMKEQVQLSAPFTNPQLVARVQVKKIYQQSGRVPSTEFNWDKAPPLDAFKEDESALDHLHQVLHPKLEKKESAEASGQIRTRKDIKDGIVRQEKLLEQIEKEIALLQKFRDEVVAEAQLQLRAEEEEGMAGQSTELVTITVADDGPLGISYVCEPPAPPRLIGIGESSMAEQIGLRVGDVVLEVNGQPAEGLTAEEFTILFQRRPVTVMVDRVVETAEEAEEVAEEVRLAAAEAKATASKRDVGFDMADEEDAVAAAISHARQQRRRCITFSDARTNVKGVLMRVADMDAGKSDRATDGSLKDDLEAVLPQPSAQRRPALAAGSPPPGPPRGSAPRSLSKESTGAPTAARRERRAPDLESAAARRKLGGANGRAAFQASGATALLGAPLYADRAPPRGQAPQDPFFIEDGAPPKDLARSDTWGSGPRSDASRSQRYESDTPPPGLVAEANARMQEDMAQLELRLQLETGGDVRVRDVEPSNRRNALDFVVVL